MLEDKIVKVLKDNNWYIGDDKVSCTSDGIWLSVPYEDTEDLIDYDFDIEEFVRDYYKSDEDIDVVTLYLDTDYLLEELNNCLIEIDNLCVEYEIEELDEIPLSEVYEDFMFDITKDDKGYHLSILLDKSLEEQIYDFGFIKTAHELKTGITKIISYFDKDSYVKEKAHFHENDDMPVERIISAGLDFEDKIFDLQQELIDVYYQIEDLEI